MGAGGFVGLRVYPRAGGGTASKIAGGIGGMGLSPRRRGNPGHGLDGC